MPIESHVKMLQRQHPEEPLEIIRLACYLGDDIAKTKAYASILKTCNDYRDIAYKVVKDMYVKCLVDKVTAQKEKTFITFLLALCPNVKDGNPHSARYHINLMLESPEVEKEREEYARKLRNEWNGGNGGDKQRVTIEISSRYREVTMPIIESLANSGAITLVEAKLNAQRKLNKSVRYVVCGNGEEIVRSVRVLKWNVGRLLGHTPKRRSIMSSPNRNRYMGIMPSIKIQAPVDKLEVPGNPNNQKLPMLTQQQDRWKKSKMVESSYVAPNGVRVVKLTAYGMRVLFDK